MKNFLRQLVQRSTGVVRPAFQPKARSRYDSAPGNARLVEERVEIIAPQPANLLPDVSVHSKSATVAQAEARSATEIERPKETLPPRTNVTRDLDLASVPAVDVVPRQPLFEHAPPTIQPQAIVRRVSEPQPEPTQGLRQIHTRETIERTREVHAESRTIETPARTFLRETIQYLPTAPTSAAAVGLPQPLAAKGEMNNGIPVFETSSAPTIRVIIGRIDIRAVHEREITPALAAPKRAHDPILSLDDYLKRRAVS